MSRHREMLRALVRLGKTTAEIAGQVPMTLQNVNRTLKDDWPIQKRFIEPLQDYVQRELRDAHSAAEPADRGAIADAFLQAFGESIQDVPDLTAEGRRAAYAASLLGIKWDVVFPHEPESNAEADDHLAVVVLGIVKDLLAEARRATDRCPEAMRYISTLCHVDDVMEGRADPAANGWMANHCGYRRGMYVFVPKPGRRNVE